MPRMYVKPEGERKLEFWKSFRGGERKEFVFVPSDWNDDDIKSELEDWCGFEYHNSEYMRYGWNDEKDYGDRS